MLSKRKEASFVDVAVFNGMRIICDCVNAENGTNVTTSSAPKVLQHRRYFSAAQESFYLIPNDLSEHRAKNNPAKGSTLKRNSN